MDIKAEHPILVISTSSACGHCTKMRGDGWPSDGLPSNIPGKWKWDLPFFRAVLTAGQNDSVQRVEFFNLHYSSFNANPAFLTEFTIFSISAKGNVLIRRFAKITGKSSHNDRAVAGDGIMHATFEENVTNLVPVKWPFDKPEAFFQLANSLERISWIRNDDKNFDQYRDSWIPSQEMAPFQIHFPTYIYFSSTIWYSSILNHIPLYPYMPGFATVHQPLDHTRYMIRNGTPDSKEYSKNVIDVLKELLENPEVLYYPYDHGKIYMSIRN